MEYGGGGNWAHILGDWSENCSLSIKLCTLKNCVHLLAMYKLLHAAPHPKKYICDVEIAQKQQMCVVRTSRQKVSKSNPFLLLR